MGCQFSGNGMIFYPHPIRHFGIGNGAIESSSAMGGWLSGGAGVSAPGAVLRQRQRGQANRRSWWVAGFPARFWLSAPVGFCGGKCAAGGSLESEWLSGKGVGSPHPVWFCGVESGVIQASAVIIGRCSGVAGGFAPRRVLRG